MQSCQGDLYCSLAQHCPAHSAPPPLTETQSITASAKVTSGSYRKNYWGHLEGLGASTAVQDDLSEAVDYVLRRWMKKCKLAAE